MYLGTARMASSVVRMTMGSMRNPSARAADSMLKSKPRASTNSARPNRPITIDGTEASVSAANLMVRTSRPWTAYSARYTAARIAIGVTMSIARAVT